MALRKNQLIRRKSDTTLTPENKLRINQTAIKIGDELLFPYEKDEGKFFAHKKNIAQTIEEPPKSKIRKSAAKSIVRTINISEYILQSSQREIVHWTPYLQNKHFRGHQIAEYYVHYNTQYGIFLENIINRLKHVKKILYTDQRTDDIGEDIIKYLRSSTKELFLQKEFEKQYKGQQPS